MLGTGLRIGECFKLPAKSGDIYRQLLTGIMVQDEGWASVAQPLTAWAPGTAAIASWADHPYNYPPLPILFFRLIASIGPSVLVAKILLTACEAANSWLVFRLTGDR